MYPNGIRIDELEEVNQQTFTMEYMLMIRNKYWRKSSQYCPNIQGTVQKVNLKVKGILFNIAKSIHAGMEAFYKYGGAVTCSRFYPVPCSVTTDPELSKSFIQGLIQLKQSLKGPRSWLAEVAFDPSAKGLGKRASSDQSYASSEAIMETPVSKRGRPSYTGLSGRSRKARKHKLSSPEAGTSSVYICSSSDPTPAPPSQCLIVPSSTTLPTTASSDEFSFSSEEQFISAVPPSAEASSSAALAITSLPDVSINMEEQSTSPAPPIDLLITALPATTSTTTNLSTTAEPATNTSSTTIVSAAIPNPAMSVDHLEKILTRKRKIVHRSQLTNTEAIKEDLSCLREAYHVIESIIPDVSEDGEEKEEAAEIEQEANKEVLSSVEMCIQEGLRAREKLEKMMTYLESLHDRLGKGK